MKRKDYVIRSIDGVTEALKALSRVNYDNAAQASRVIWQAREKLSEAARDLMIAGEVS